MGKEADMRIERGLKIFAGTLIFTILLGVLGIFIMLFVWGAAGIVEEGPTVLGVASTIPAVAIMVALLVAGGISIVATIEDK